MLGMSTETIISTLVGAGISLLASLAIAEGYFRRQFEKQAEIDKARAEKEVELAFKRLSNAFIAELFRKKPKKRSFSLELHNEMSEASQKLKVYRPDFDVDEMFKKAAEAAAEIIRNKPDDFEDID